MCVCRGKGGFKRGGDYVLVFGVRLEWDGYC